MTHPINNPVNTNDGKWPESIPLPLYYCKDCRVSRIPPFLPRCSNCCDTEEKQNEQIAACERNKAFYGKNS